MQATDQAGFVGMKADRDQVDLEVLGLENDVGARDREFADPALPETAADHDAFGIGPGLGLEKAPRHIGEFLPMASADLVPRGSSPFFFSGLRSVSKISRNAPLLARSPRKRSSSFNSILKLSTSTDGRRVAP